MTSPRSERSSATSPQSSRVAPRDGSTHEHFVFSYEPLLRSDEEPVDAEDIVPSRGPHETDVWLTEWQVAEDGFDVAVDQHVDWALVPMDQNWVARLFVGRRTVSLQLDVYAEATQDLSEPLVWAHLSGHVARIDQISVRYYPSEVPEERGVGVAETGGAMQHSVLCLRKPRTFHGELVGWIVRVQG
ncbi:hypothetical protein [Cryobacterium cryoconiti]|uniref:Uncharacterized protein n=1 Tax=Cryobacterium cryoconiti TaxID=1259239 RepID=A0A4Y8JQZ3_9MICO|nr:hypothetical protein [Cryobacterium cryoconiti]TFD26983.1 hypothetical protein E3T49_13930 [Cryobacterium cryoconiti]